MEKIYKGQNDSEPEYIKDRHNSRRNKLQRESKTTRDSKYSRKSKPIEDPFGVDRKNEIHLETSDTHPYDSRHRSGLTLDTPTDSMMMPAIKKKILSTKTKTKIKPTPAYQEATIEESSFNDDRQRGFDNERYFNPKHQKANTHNQVAKGSKQVKIDLTNQDEEDWEVKTTSKGFIYFKLKGTDDCQWEFPRVYDYKTRKYKSVFLRHWVKMRNPKTGAAFWRNQNTGITQT